MNNDFHDRTTIFDIFKDLKLDWDAVDKQTTTEPQVNGNHAPEAPANGASKEPVQVAAAS